MKFGFYGVNIGACATMDNCSHISRAAEEAGFESLWVMDHPILPSPVEPPSVMPPSLPILDPIPTLAFLAGRTHSIRLATGILLLPQRNPVILAKELASLDVLSQGRLSLGVAVGYVPQEYAALGVPFAERGLRMDEGIDALRALWCQPEPEMNGRTVAFSKVDAHPRPVQSPCPPIIVGGDSAPALRRALLRGNGWYGVHKDIDATRKLIGEIRELEKTVERPAGLGQLEISITPTTDHMPTEQEIETFAGMGVDRLILWPMPHINEFDAQTSYLEQAGDLIHKFKEA